MAVNKTTARIILDCAFTGLGRDAQSKVGFMIQNISQTRLQQIQNKAATLGESIKINDINEFTSVVMFPQYTTSAFDYALDMDLVFPSEVISISMSDGNNTWDVEMMNMHRCEFLVISSSNETLFPHNTMLQTYDDTVFKHEGPLKLDYKGSGNVKLTRIEKVAPTATLNLLNNYFYGNSLSKHNVTDNLWNAHSLVRDYLNSDMKRDDFDQLIDKFRNFGLSIFVLLKLIQAYN